MSNYYYDEDCQYFAKQLKKAHDKQKVQQKVSSPLMSKASKMESVKASSKSNPNAELLSQLKYLLQNSKSEQEIVYLTRIIKGLEMGLISLN